MKKRFTTGGGILCFTLQNGTAEALLMLLLTYGSTGKKLMVLPIIM